MEVVNIDVGFCGIKSIGNKSRDHVGNKVPKASMSGVLNLALVFQDIVDALHYGPFSEQYFII